MANRLSRFNKYAIGSKGKISDFTARVAASGDFVRVEDIETILSSWNNILLTPTRSYNFDPEFGSELYKYVFEPADEVTAAAISEEVEFRLSLYDDRAVVNSVDVAFLSNLKGFTVSIYAEYDGEEASLSAVIDETIYFNFLRET